MTNIAPWLSVRDATQAAEYYKAAFGAVELERLAEADEVMVAQLSIDGAEFWIQREPDTVVDGSQVRMLLTVDEPDTVFTTAIAAGATEVAPIHEDHGWRVGRLSDPYGHHWEIGRRL
jgi:PhnB protein